MILCSKRHCATTECDCGERIAEWAIAQAKEIERLIVEHTRFTPRRSKTERARS